MRRLWIVCMYCGKDMGCKDGDGVGGVSHSICTTCYSRFIENIQLYEPAGIKRN